MGLLSIQKRRKIRDQSRHILLGYGSHNINENSYCVMEYVAKVAGEEHGHLPYTSCPTLTDMMIQVNDTIGDNERQILLGLVPFLIGTNRFGNKKDRIRSLILAFCHQASLQSKKERDKKQTDYYNKIAKLITIGQYDQVNKIIDENDEGPSLSLQSALSLYRGSSYNLIGEYLARFYLENNGQNKESVERFVRLVQRFLINFEAKNRKSI